MTAFSPAFHPLSRWFKSAQNPHLDVTAQMCARSDLLNVLLYLIATFFKRKKIKQKLRQGKKNPLNINFYYKFLLVLTNEDHEVPISRVSEK